MDLRFDSSLFRFGLVVTCGRVTIWIAASFLADFEARKIGFTILTVVFLRDS